MAATDAPATLATAPPADRLGDELMTFLAHAVRTQQHRIFRAAADADLSLAQLQGLCALQSAAEPLALHDLVDVMGLSVGATSRAVDALYRAGLVSRREDERDRRVKRIAITDAGRAVLERIDETRRAVLRGFVATLSDDEREGLGAALRPVLERLGER
jgi:DNA-binding MarR family transcriptional regulator